MILLSCREAARTLAEADAEIPWGRKALLRLHLLICAGCTRFARQLRALGDAARSRRPGAAAVRALEGRILEKLSGR